jgi:hypothetical protein
VDAGASEAPQIPADPETCVVDRCRGRGLRTTVLLITTTEETAMDLRYPNPALEAELAYRREQMMAAARRGVRTGSWPGSRRPR